MKEYIDSFWKNIEKRMSSPIYGALIASWIIFNSELMITLFFVGENIIFEKYGLLKNEYIYLFLDLKNGWNWIKLILLPIISTWLAIWVLPNLILFKAFQKDEEYGFKKKEERLTNEIKIQDLRNQLVSKEKQEKKDLKDTMKIEEDIKKESPEKIWDEEFNKFKSTKYYEDFKYILSSIYDHNGLVRNYRGSINFEVPRRILAYVDSNELTKFSEDRASILFTEKGLYFVRKYQEEI